MSVKTIEQMDQNQFETIEAYLSERMSQKDRAEFEAQLESDQELRREVEVQQASIMAVELGAFSRMVESIGSDYDSSNPSIDRGRKGGIQWLGIAAGVLLLISAGVWFLNRSESVPSLYAEYYETDPGLPVVMGGSGERDFDDAMVDYRAGKYVKAYEKWSVLDDANTNDTVQYFMAMCLLEQGKEESAVEVLQRIADSRSAFKVKAQWYLFLTHIGSNDTEAALLVSVDQDSVYHSRWLEVRSRIED